MILSGRERGERRGKQPGHGREGRAVDAGQLPWGGVPPLSRPLSGLIAALMCAASDWRLGKQRGLLSGCRADIKAGSPFPLCWGLLRPSELALASVTQ